MNRKRLLGAGALALLVGGGALWALRAARAATTRLEPAIILEQVLARAVVVPRRGVAEVRPRIDGRVLSVSVSEGEQVKAGQLLAELEPESARTAVALREAEAQSLGYSARSVRQGARSEEIDAAEAELRAAAAELALLQERQAREEELDRRGASTTERVQEARRASEIAQARVEGARARSKLARAGGRASDTRAADARVTAARAATELARLELERTRLVAPIDGVVLARRVDPGDTLLGAQAGVAPSAFELADAQDLELRVEVEELLADRVSVGTLVRVTTPGGSRTVGEGRLVRVGGRLEPRTIGAQDARERGEGWVRAAWAEVTWPGGAPPLGQRFEVILQLGERRVEAAAPRGAVRVTGGRAVVERAWGPLSLSTPVHLGLADDQRVEVRGLPPGTVLRWTP